ncbi:hypothetical protein OHA40_00370 [Nocardia sp. NBC_00508]|uniref:hypothetical protein n=1 Tax=Nocardia sp. NBC_00508 TaxID=2975992 RepID=UPI002E81D28D|nr:hypothetical protein [Nocardia sp. NBC_00508]WUD66670.1 hypothetical protein OHA40_00370 [Nocardia sp. NBC_00508]
MALLLALGVIGFAWTSKQKGTETVADQSETNTVLSIGLHPSAIDYSRIPGLDEATLTARIAVGEQALHDAGFDIVSCLVEAEPDAAEATLRDCAATKPFGIAMIGAGIRAMPEHTLLFERLVNVVNEISPGVKFCFNTSPETTIDALRRWIQPGNR